jgi:hypothetical protein
MEFNSSKRIYYTFSTSSLQSKTLNKTSFSTDVRSFPFLTETTQSTPMKQQIDTRKYISDVYFGLHRSAILPMSRANRA